MVIIIQFSDINTQDSLLYNLYYKKSLHNIRYANLIVSYSSTHTETEPGLT